MGGRERSRSSRVRSIGFVRDEGDWEKSGAIADCDGVDTWVVIGANSEEEHTGGRAAVRLSKRGCARDSANRRGQTLGVRLDLMLCYVTWTVVNRHQLQLCHFPVAESTYT